MQMVICDWNNIYIVVGSLFFHQPPTFYSFIISFPTVPVLFLGAGKVLCGDVSRDLKLTLELRIFRAASGPGMEQPGRHYN
jgi:hypothetical protein